MKEPKSLNAIEERARRRSKEGEFKHLIRLINDLRKQDSKIKNKLHVGAEPPKVGEDIYVGGSMYIDHGEDDTEGGLAEVTKVEWAPEINGGTFEIEVAELPSKGFYWNSLVNDQEMLKKEHGKSRAHPDPDNG